MHAALLPKRQMGLVFWVRLLEIVLPSPLVPWMDFPATPFKSSDDVPEFKMSLIHEMHLWPKPKLVKIWIITLCSILSNVFSKSSLRIISSFLEADMKVLRSSSEAILYCPLFNKAVLIFLDQVLDDSLKPGSQNVNCYIYRSRPLKHFCSLNGCLQRWQFKRSASI